MLSFDEFQDYVRENIKSFLPENLQDARVELNEVNKNNGLILHAILVRPEESNIAPTVYLEGFYRSYEDGADLKDVMRDIAETSARNQEPLGIQNIARDFMNFEFVKEKIVMNVVSADKNQEMLQGVPHMVKEDLAIIYKVLLGKDENGSATITIKNQHLDYWGVDVDQINSLAVENSKRLMPATCMSMNDVMLQMMGEAAFGDEMLAELMNEQMPLDQQMYVITNADKLDGAAAIFYSDALAELTEKLGSDVYILPSSIHEVIAVSTNMGDPEELAMMVQEVNEGQVELEEQLSDHVYRYDAETKSISIADGIVAVQDDTKQEGYDAPGAMPALAEPMAEYGASTQEAARPRHHR